MIAPAEKTGRRDAAAPAAAAWLGLAAAPTFAAMALLAGLPGADTMCSGAHGILPLNGMAVMYALMSVFNATPWLRLLSKREGRHTGDRVA